MKLYIIYSLLWLNSFDIHETVIGFKLEFPNDCEVFPRHLLHMDI